MPTVSVITPCYNSEKFIGATIQSVRDQSFEDWEYIVVDDGSTDASLQVMESCAVKDQRIRFLSLTHQGVCHARNQGFEASSKSSRYLLFLDADDCLEQGMLQELVPYLDRHSEVGLARCEYRFVDGEGRFIDYREDKHRYIPSRFWVKTLPPREPETPFVSVFTLCAIIPSISLIRRDLFEKAGGFDETFGHHHEDIDLFARIALLSKIHFVPLPLVRRRRHRAQNTADTPEFRAKAAAQYEKFYKKWKDGHALSPEQRKIVAKAWKFKQGRLEPYLAFGMARESLGKKEYARALRLYLGGLRRYLISFWPGMS